jgi:hypothetical protein
MPECLIETQNCEPTFIPMNKAEEYPLADFLDFDAGSKFRGTIVMRFPDKPVEMAHGVILISEDGIEFLED